MRKKNSFIIISKLLCVLSKSSFYQLLLSFGNNQLKLKIVEMVICSLMKKVLQMVRYFDIKIPVLTKYEKFSSFLRKIPIQRIQNCIIFSAHALYSFQSIAFLLLEADDPIDYKKSVFFNSHSMVCLASYTLFALQKPTILRQIVDFNALVHQSKWLWWSVHFEMC